MKISITQLLPCIMRKKYKGYVLYGHNEPLIHGVLREVRENVACEMVSEERIQNEGLQLLSPCLFGQTSELIVVSSVKQVAWYGPLIKHSEASKAILIVLSSPCPMPFIQALDIAVVACYECALEDSKFIMQRYAQRYCFKLSPEVLDLCAHMGKDGNWAEMAKMLSCQSEPITEELLNILWTKPVDESFATLFLEGVSFFSLDDIEPMKVLRAWQRLLLQMWQLKLLMRHDEPKKALTLVKPVIFFKHVPLILKKLPLWTCERFAFALKMLLECEKNCKQDLGRASQWMTQFLYRCANN
jgi:hypothetical protein